MARTRLIQAIRDGVVEEMERDAKVVVYGEDVELSIVGDLRGVHERFGPGRIRNTPICETTLTGMAVGLAAAGYHVVVQMMFSNFLYTGMDAIGNQMSKLRLMTGGQVELPITVIATFGGGAANAAQHSDTPYAMLMNLGGLNVAVPTTPADAKGLVKTAIRSRNPCFVLEPNGRGGEAGEVPDGEHLVPFGKAAVRREGDAATVVAIGRMLKPALAAAASLETEGVSVEVLDPRTLVPFDEAAVLASVEKTGRLIVVDEARECCSAASQVAAVVAEKGFSLLKGPIRRVTTPNVAIPYAPNAEAHVIPGKARIVDAVRGSVSRSEVLV
ncbi:alpha-ketoacid dehydrogenase subunit beta [Amycolatopsis alkalitolerans]|uniref:Alpha-ketoacid dehydrogenase subunit beta n=1 Tax=Amycolatopsis alkalitolerans TaxID=2547244 RepID=A0A5C4M1Q3_9PSEU|nr:transketolase C-terminal domain-containing protein [Amycolatopsis alkalitolerans]TNC25857.1 alpha-ketoacid dehydrogenase subunit beta [Amycolatopsis alkalitolerans]